MATTTIKQQWQPWNISNNGDHGVAIMMVTMTTKRLATMVITTTK